MVGRINNVTSLMMEATAMFFCTIAELLKAGSNGHVKIWQGSSPINRVWLTF